MSNRDNFTKKKIDELAKRVAWLCSNPNCRQATIGAKSEGEGFTIIGVAAHITAAAPGGQRYNFALTPAQRGDISNGIWLCSNCSILIDRDSEAYPVSLLQKWKSQAENRSFAAIAGSNFDVKLIRKISVEIDEADLALIKDFLLPQDGDIENVTVRLRNAARRDIETFKSERSWPKHVVPINMASQDGDGAHVLSLAGVATAMEIVDEISIIAEPGLGKTTMMVQLADAILASDGGVAVFIPLSAWSLEADTFFKMLTRRNAFRIFSEQHFMVLAYHGRLQLLLDGWNELDHEAKRRVARQIQTLRRDFPRIRIAISTRPQAEELPISGPIIELKALSEEQQQEIAYAFLGDDGTALLEQAWQTDGVRELVSIPIYLNWLLAYTATSGNLPVTKEEILNRFVAEYEKEQERALILRKNLFGCHQVILTGLASKGINHSTTVIQEVLARTIISKIETDLVTRGQITGRPEPLDVLDLLVNNHLLVRSGENAGYSFQHQQIQEWYASFEVESTMRIAETGNTDALKRLRVDILNLPLWEESILFACERLSYGDQKNVNAVANAILQCISIDPLLAAEMIYRSSQDIWEIIADKIKTFVFAWHKQGKVDRAVGFMITSGRPDFAEQIWPLVTHSDDQIHLKAIRSARHFRPSVLGINIQERMNTVPEEVRESVLAAIVMESGIDGINLITNLAKAETSAKVQFAIIEALLFRHAKRSAIAIIKVAAKGVWHILARTDYVDEIADAEVAERWKQEHQKYIEEETNLLTKLQLLLADNDKDNADIGKQVENVIASNEFPIKVNDAYWTLVKAKERYPQEVSEAILRRIETAMEIPVRMIDLLLEGSPFIEDGEIFRLIVDTSQNNRLADEATIVAGPGTVSILIKKLLELDTKIQEMDRQIEKTMHDEYWRIVDRICRSQLAVLIPELQHYGETHDPHIIALLADILARYAQNNEAKLLNMNEDLQESLVKTINQWIETLQLQRASRGQLAEVVQAISFFPKPDFFDGLKNLLMEELSQWKQLQDELAKNSRKGHYLQGASMRYTNHYKNAFAALGGDKVIQLMTENLPDLDFGIEAAYVLKIIWDKQHGDYERKTLKNWPDFSEAAFNYQQRQKGVSTYEAPFVTAIFSAIHDITLNECGDREHRHILKLAQIAVSMPHDDKGSITSGLLQLPVPLSGKLELLTSLVVAGYKISADMVLQGLKDLLEEAKQKPWLLDAQHNQIEEWIQLLPFTDRPEALDEALVLDKGHFKETQKFRGLLAALAYAPNTQAELSLFKLADDDPRFYKDYEWLNAIVLLDTVSSVTKLLELICNGKVEGNWHGPLSEKLSDLLTRYPDMYHTLLQRYRSLPVTCRLRIKNLIAWVANEEGLLLLVQSYEEEGLEFDWILEKMIKEIAMGRKTLAYSQAFEYHSVDVSDLRKELFAMVDEANMEVNVAASCLEIIDELRDEYGSVDSEPRHPDIESGRSWPIV